MKLTTKQKAELEGLREQVRILQRKADLFDAVMNTITDAIRPELEKICEQEISIAIDDLTVSR